jgi:nascent polypeptide-associated complex subunit alpha
MLGGLGGLNPKKMQAMMKQMGMSQEEIAASRVIIEKKDNTKIVIENPSVVKINIQGQDSFQVSGNVKEELGVSEEDVKTVMERTGQPEDIVRKTILETGDLAGAILKLSE